MVADGKHGTKPFVVMLVPTRRHASELLDTSQLQEPAAADGRRAETLIGWRRPGFPLPIAGPIPVLLPQSWLPSAVHVSAK